MSSTTSRGAEWARSRALYSGNGSVVCEALRPAIASWLFCGAVEDSSRANRTGEQHAGARGHRHEADGPQHGG